MVSAIFNGNFNIPAQLIAVSMPELLVSLNEVDS